MAVNCGTSKLCISRTKKVTQSSKCFFSLSRLPVSLSLCISLSLSLSLSPLSLSLYLFVCLSLSLFPSLPHVSLSVSYRMSLSFSLPFFTPCISLNPWSQVARDELLHGKKLASTPLRLSDKQEWRAKTKKQTEEYNCKGPRRTKRSDRPIISDHV